MHEIMPKPVKYANIYNINFSTYFKSKIMCGPVFWFNLGIKN